MPPVLEQNNQNFPNQPQGFQQNPQPSRSAQPGPSYGQLPTPNFNQAQTQFASQNFNRPNPIPNQIPIQIRNTPPNQFSNQPRPVEQISQNRFEQGQSKAVEAKINPIERAFANRKVVEEAKPKINDSLALILRAENSLGKIEIELHKMRAEGGK